jgi:uncharacterized membrane protein
MQAPSTCAPRPRGEAFGRRSRVFAQIALKIAYPLVILAAWRIGSPRYIGVALFALLWLERWFGAGGVVTLLARLTALEWVVAGVLSCVSAAIALTDSEGLLRFYPVFVNAGMLLAFGATLRDGTQSMIERFARLREPVLSEHAVRHTRRVTLLWCGFFTLNGAASAACALWGSRLQWALYNGVIAYVLIGTLIVGEIVWRHMFVLRAEA